MGEAESGSTVSSTLFKFVNSVLSYCDALREIRPKRERVAYLEQELETQTKLLGHINEEIIELDVELNELHIKYAQAITEKQILQEMLEQAEIRVVRTTVAQLVWSHRRQQPRTTTLAILLH